MSEQNLIEIPITGATLFLTEKELMNNLPENVKIAGLKRGKGIKRSRQRKKRDAAKYGERLSKKMEGKE